MTTKATAHSGRSPCYAFPNMRERIVAEPATRPMSEAEFFAWQERQEERYEYVDGRLIPRSMTGATQRHDRVLTNAIAAFVVKLRGSPCRPMSPDVAVRTRPGRLRRPDVTVDCGPYEASSLVAHTPVLVLEVLSPSTERVDTIVKVGEYKALASLRHILIAEPDAAHVLHYARGDEGDWAELDHIGLGTVIDLPALGCTLSLAELYDGVPLAGDPPGV